MICFGGINMAIWQTYYKVVPRKYKSKKHLQNNKCIWGEYSLDQNSVNLLSHHLHQTSSWNCDCIQYGEIDCTCVEINYENNFIDEISVRFDLRTLNKEVLQAIVSFIDVNGSILVSQNEYIVNPCIDDVIASIKDSTAYKFIKNGIEGIV